MHILYLAQRVPYPPDRGDKIPTFRQVQHLAQKHDVTIACPAADAEEMVNAEKLAAHGPRVYAVPFRPFRAKLRALKALTVGRCFTSTYWAEPGLRRCVSSLVASGTIDLIIANSSGMAPLVEHASDVPRIMQFVDLDSLKWKRYARTSWLPNRWIYALESRRLLEYERQIAREFDHSIVVTMSELQDFKRLIAVSNASCVRNGVDVDYFRPSDAPKKANSLIVTGVMNYLPNVDGVRWFCQRILPLIRERIPDVTFTICGARPARRVRELGNLAGVTVTGTVPDVRPYLAEACAAVVPLRMARGVQNKVLEAMAMGLPVVTTSAAFEGISATKGTDLVVADKAEQFARDVIRLLENDDLRRQIGDAARACIEKNYQWHVPLSKLDSIIEAVLEQRLHL